jgi:hypothetical protein
MERLVMRIEPTADYPHGTRLPTDDEILQHPAVVAALARAREGERRKAIETCIPSEYAAGRRDERKAVVEWFKHRATQHPEAITIQGWWVDQLDTAEAIEAGAHLPQPATEDPA